MQLAPVEEDVLRRYTRAVYHLRGQLSRKKLMPVFGAGASQSIGLPNWTDLVAKIADHPEVCARAVLERATSQASLVQLVFHHFRRSKLRAEVKAGRIEDEDSTSISFERKVAFQWREIIHSCLYASARDVATHPYLEAFVPVIKRAPLTVNYNFDDTLQILLSRAPKTDLGAPQQLQVFGEIRGTPVGDATPERIQGLPQAHVRHVHTERRVVQGLREA
jgi:hypothetical protein